MRNKLISLGLSTFMLLTLVSGVFAQPDLKSGEVQNPVTGERHATVRVPVQADQAPAIVDLGTAQDVDGRLVQGYMFIHYRDAFSHKPGHNPGGSGAPATNKCYSFLANGAKWKSGENYLVNSTNSEDLTDSFVRSSVANALSKWEDAANGTVGDGTSKNILASLGIF